jgi:hypothetical protein
MIAIEDGGRRQRRRWQDWLWFGNGGLAFDAGEGAAKRKFL